MSDSQVKKEDDYMPKEKNEISELTLEDAIKRKLRRKELFENLEPIDKADVLRYIKNKKLGLRVFGRRGYDIINKNFFAYEYVLESDDSYRPTIIKNEFETFDRFFEGIKGDLYNNQSCFYSYIFSKSEKEEFKLKINDMNFDSFVKDDISMYTFDSLKAQETELDNEKIKIKRFKLVIETKEYLLGKY